MTDHNTETNPRELEPELLKDRRYVYGARCTWHGPFSATDRSQHPSMKGIPVCPHCHGVLFEYPNKATWDNAAAEFEKKHPGFVEFIEWLGTVGQCWPNMVAGADAYTEATGKKVQLGT